MASKETEAYAAGCNIVILASNFERVQIIPGVTHGNIKVSCIDCSSDTGKIAASYGRKVHIFEPTPLIHETSHKLDYKWYLTATIEVDCFVNALTWNMEGSKLLTGGDSICIWQFEMNERNEDEGSNKKVQFSLGTDDEDPLINQLSHALHGDNKDTLTHGPGSWQCVWRCKPATTVYHLKFSPDGFLFASAGKADRLVKIWYEDRKVTPQLIRTDSISPKKDEMHYSFVYIAHPRSVTGFSWRRTSKYMPRGSVANMLVTSCLDNVCRIWCETILPDDGLVDLEQFDPSSTLDAKYNTSRHKKRFMQRLKTIRHAIHKRRKQPKYGPETVMSVGNLSSMGSVHDFHKFAIHHNGVSPVLHFHLAGSINPETDIPLQPVTGNKGDVEHNFKINWLNNKELQFTIEAEKILQDLYKQLSYEDHNTTNQNDEEDHDSSHDNSDSDHDDQSQKKKKAGFFKRRGKYKNKGLGSHTDSASSLSSDHGSEGSNPEFSTSMMDNIDRKIEVLLRDWHQNPDMLFSIHPVDGSFLVWLVDWLDEYTPVCFRQAQVSFSSRLPHAFPIADARSMSSNLLMYCNYSKMDIKSAMKLSPLSKSGGIIELARINAPSVSAFANVAWVPTLLPSTSLGSYSNSPSALFVASDGSRLRLYQALIDARSLLSDSQSKQETQGMSFSSTSSSFKVDNNTSKLPSELFNIVSEQSSSRPGCIIELEGINDAMQDWQNVQLLHVFQEQLVTGKMSSHDAATMGGAIVDLRNVGVFEENFYLVVLEKMVEGGSVLHMWKITISSQPGGGHEGYENSQYSGSVFEAEYDTGTSSGDTSPEDMNPRMSTVMTMSITTTKVCTQSLDLPDDVDVICATVSAGHLSSASIYPACFAPYQLVTACTDGEIRFWKCDLIDLGEGSLGLTSTNMSCLSVTSYEFSMDNEGKNIKPHVITEVKSHPQDVTFNWSEWEMMSPVHASSSIALTGRPITISCAYSGRFSVAYRYGHITTQTDNLTDKFVNLCVAIYECESTGGSEWVLEDTIELKNIKIPDPKSEIDLDLILNPDKNRRDSTPGGISPSSSIVNMTRTKSVPSLCTIQTVRKSIAEQGNRLGVLQQKSLVQLDWVSTEDGSHILTVGVGPKILTYSQVSNEIAQASTKAMSSLQEKQPKEQVKRARPLLQKSKSLVMEDYQEEIRWMRLRAVELNTADGLPPLPMHLSWVRAGILVIGMDNEMHVYSQWRDPLAPDDDVADNKDDFNIDKRTLTEANLTQFTTGSVRNNFNKRSTFKASYSMPSFKHASKNFSHVSLKKKEWQKSEQNSTTSKSSLQRSDSLTSLSVIHDFGLFEAARMANPVLPQYHPKQLMELLNFGKIKRVKAILAHLVRCITGGEGMQSVFVDDTEDDGRRFRSHSVSVSAVGKDNPVIVEDVSNFAEINSIPPLPMYALLAADADNSGINMEIAKSGAVTSPNKAQQDYTDLFVTNVMDDEEFDINDLSTSADSAGGKRSKLSSSTPAQNPYLFIPSQAKVLADHLLQVQLPGLSSLDQMYLMALADTVASTKTDLAEQISKPEQDEAAVEGEPSLSLATESMDDCGLRFLLAMRHHIYLLGTLLPGPRRALAKNGLKSFNLVWAFHSEATEELLSFIPSMKKGEPIWEELRQFGAGWWVNNLPQLKKVIEKVAKSAFQANKDPLDAALFYLAMKKKNVLWGLYRSVDNRKMSDFFKNDFTQERWRKAALKNAFALLGKQMFMQAAAFFLLGGSLNDAINVCLERLNDIQLAIVICRLYDGEEMLPLSVQKILNTNILGYDESGDNYNPRHSHPNPFLRSMSYWMFKKYKEALQTLLQTKVGRPKLSTETDLDAATITPNVFNFYNYLRTHPLLVRQQLALASPGHRKAVMTGFTKSNSVAVQDHNITTIDKVTPMERRLFFATAHVHFKNGCPLLALEVLSKLPPVVDEKENEKIMNKNNLMMNQNGSLSTGTLESSDLKSSNVEDNSKASDFDWSQPVTSEKKETADAFDWSQPLSNGTTSSIDWGEPISSQKIEKADDFDWSTPTSRVRFEDEPEFTLGSSSEDEDEEINKDIPTVTVEDPSGVITTEKPSQKIDIMAQQYKFIACLKVLMEELGTLATGFEVDGGQLRYQLYIWLEKEAEILKALCSYGVEEDISQHPLADTTLDSSRDSDDMLEPVRPSRSLSIRSDTSASKASLHEVIMSDKLDLEAKMERMSRRKQWLKMNQQLLRTLISYCIMQGSGGGGLASVRMELLLLLQELQQEKPQHQLLSPLPFPTTLPLLSASIASSKTVISDPIQHLQCMSQDMLHTIIELLLPPGLSTDLSNVYLLRNLAVALSSCIYQCLCDSDNFVVSLNDNMDIGLEGFSSPNFACQASYLMTGIKRRRGRSHSGGVGDEMVNTPAAKWPGVTSLKVLLAREKDEDAPKLNILLTESLLAVYISLLVNGLSTYDPLLLYRLVAHKFDEKMWSALFGGGAKTIFKSNNPNIPLTKPSEDELAKHRMRLNMRVMGSSPSPKPAEMKESYKEKFIPPELSMITFFMTKPFVPSSESVISYDSDDSVLSDDEPASDSEDDFEVSRPKTLALDNMQQHSDPNSYSWCLIRYCIVHHIYHNIQLFLPLVGIELAELPNCSPLLHALMKMLEQWDEMLYSRLELFACPPESYIPGLHLDVTTGVPQSKYQALLNPSNTPFVNDQSSLPMKRLWFQLIKQDVLKDIFIRYIFRNKKPHLDSADSMRTTTTDSDTPARSLEPMKIIHKEQDIITAFSINQAHISLCGRILSASLSVRPSTFACKWSKN
ncbi:hypothetical protein LOTGIDRAFT_235301 [Lottia gigantea]|uniref:RAVE complex protein Rav1 C-terminal domain-containing protein n=1 Tax=Lottia gigantea TaxID=225164 RepID=V4A0B9_LOTGI|nr:hypothetical protein LOTGIDRAFT_235301 [Lottia gigantea]ESO86706.1 hypothetical protein LOTGIDRAFT_235301 [Lottia gigantea]